MLLSAQSARSTTMLAQIGTVQVAASELSFDSEEDEEEEEEEEAPAATEGRQEGRTRGGSLEKKGCRSDSVVDLLMGGGGASQGGDTRK